MELTNCFFESYYKPEIFISGFCLRQTNEYDKVTQ